MVKSMESKVSATSFSIHEKELVDYGKNCIYSQSFKSNENENRLQKIKGVINRVHKKRERVNQFALSAIN